MKKIIQKLIIAILAISWYNQIESQCINNGGFETYTTPPSTTCAGIIDEVGMPGNLSNWSVSHGSPYCWDLTGVVGCTLAHTGVHTVQLNCITNTNLTSNYGKSWGVFTPFNFIKNEKYRVCVWVSNDNCNSTSAAKGGNLNIIAANGLNSAPHICGITTVMSPPIVPHQLIDKSYSFSTNWTLVSVEFIANDNYSKLWLYPTADGTNNTPIKKSNGPPSPAANDYEIFIDDVSVTRIPTISPLNPNYCKGVSSPIQLNATGGTSYSWKVLSGDMTSLSCTTCKNPTVSPNSTSVYECTINGTSTCTPNCGAIPSNILQTTVNVFPNINANFTYSLDCNNKASFNSGNSTGFIHKWTFLDDNSTSTMYNPIHQYITPGTYQVKHELTSPCGTTISQTQTIVIQPSSVKIAINPINVCFGDIYNVSATSGFNSYNWTSNPTSTLPSTSNFSVTATNTTNYQVSVLNTTNNCTYTDNLTVNVTILPSLKINNIERVPCKESCINVQFDLDDINDIKIIFDGDESYNPTSNNFAYCFAPGYHSITLTNGSCSKTYDFEVLSEENCCEPGVCKTLGTNKCSKEHYKPSVNNSVLEYQYIGQLESGDYGNTSVLNTSGENNIWSNIGRPVIGQVGPKTADLYGYTIQNSGNRAFFGTRDHKESSDAVIAWGSDNNSKLSFEFHDEKCNSVKEVATMLPNGNIGINNASPTEKLQLSGGNILLDDNHKSGGVEGNMLIGGKTWANEDGMRLSYGKNYEGAYFDVKTDNANKGLIFRVDKVNGGSERMRITSDGKVGIGTKDPNHKLSVSSEKENDGIYVSSLGNGGEISAQDDSHFPVTSNFTRNNPISMPQYGIAFPLSQRNGVPRSAETWISGFDGISLFSNSKERMVVNEFGDVGIGTRDIENADGWQRVLDVRGFSHSKIQATTEGNGGLGIESGLWAHNIGSFGRNSSGGFTGTATPHDFSIITNKTARMTILSNGRIGIGTTNPTSMLHVNNGIIMIENPITGNNGLAFKQTGNTSVNGQWGIQYNTTCAGSSNGLNFWKPGVANNILFLSDNQNVGIGTCNPTQRLTVFNGTTTGTYTTRGWAHSSDKRLKENIASIQQPIEIIISLNGVYYNWKNSDDKNRQVGFIAQDVQKVLPEVVVGSEGEIEKGETLGMVYQNIVPVLVEAFKELNTKVETQSSSSIVKENEELKSKISKLEERLASYDEKFALLEKSITVLCESGCDGLKSVSKESTPDIDKLFQSIPNPTDDIVLINYYLVRDYSDASISLNTQDGKVLRTIKLDGKQGNGFVKVSLADLSNGTYLYSLTAGERVIDTKRLQIVK